MLLAEAGGIALERLRIVADGLLVPAQKQPIAAQLFLVIGQAFGMKTLIFLQLGDIVHHPSCLVKIFLLVLLEPTKLGFEPLFFLWRLASDFLGLLPKLVKGFSGFRGSGGRFPLQRILPANRMSRRVLPGFPVFIGSLHEIAILVDLFSQFREIFLKRVDFFVERGQEAVGGERLWILDRGLFGLVFG
ncbi:hypothetical protein MAMC_00618 [Methylacidimicrobium cyclopophantes]|uniref:Uncharacterized protein n=1 Tax=Methylacidimicrobium cyclopophantes TaxID=1041766 RepID=A0A5E6M8I9_9BACT|nr:hypothetical protein MAMC_00618 [Methylacidimicrobium cyclopophantes]